ncbi:MAG TPA: hypothetical protein DCZ94_19045 [Lentisphaeria bacterium]|nr:MAG: hypothetical protein A2X48_08845 [Lentisphaerae bacterium GWF2_49_21]HBC89042.1 hypothetical protein [Lentisphaeria bacterium]
MSIAPPKSIEELARRLEMDCVKLISISVKAPLLYGRKEIPREGKPPRIIEPPHKNLKELQRKLLDTTLIHLRCDDSLFARKGTNTVDAVIPHISKPILITMDIKNFFPSVSHFQVKTALKSRGIPDDVAKLITRLTTHRHHLPQGAPTSVELGRLVMHPVALEVKRALDATGTNYAFSMYVDDVIISGPVGLKRMIGIIYKIYERHGFNLDKSIKMRTMRLGKDVQEALGIRIDRGIEPGEAIRLKLAHANSNSKEHKGLRSYASHLQNRNKKYSERKKCNVGGRCKLCH